MDKERFLIILSLTLVVAPFSTKTAAQSVDNKDEIIGGFAESIKQSAALSVSITAEIDSTCGYEGVFALDGRRKTDICYCDGSQRVTSIWSGEDPVPPSKIEYIITKNGDVLNISTMLDEQLNPLPLDDDGINLALMLSSRKISDSPIGLRDRETVYRFLEESAISLWRIGYTPLDSFIKTSEAKVERTEEGVTVSASSKHGNFMALLSKENGWLPKRFSMVKDRNSLIGNRPVKDFYVPDRDPAEERDRVAVEGDDLPSVVVERMEWSGEITEFSKSPNGIWYASEAKVNGSTHFDEGVNSFKASISIKPIPEDECDCNPTSEIPVGYAVSVQNASHLPYLWNGKAAVPGIPKLPSRQPVTEKQHLKANGSWMTIAINIGVIVLLAMILIIRSTRKNA